MLTVQRVPRIPKTTKSGSVTDTEREESEQRAKTEETQTDTGGELANLFIKSDAFCSFFILT